MKRNILITGASGNLGKPTVEKFVAEGYKVIATVSPGKKLGYETVVDIETIEADLTNEELAEEVIKKIIDQFGSIDAAILLVGSFLSGGINETDGAAMRKMYALNFETAYFVARPVFIQMKKQMTGGRIIFIGSRPSLDAEEGKDFLAYGLSKSLLFKLSEYLNASGSSYGINTSVIVPGVIDTPLNRKSNPDFDFSKWVRPEEIAEVIAFLTSDHGSKLHDGVLKIYERP